MKKTAILLLAMMLLLSGCGVIVWNATSEAPKKTKTKETTAVDIPSTPAAELSTSAGETTLSPEMRASQEASIAAALASSMAEAARASAEESSRAAAEEASRMPVEMLALFNEIGPDNCEASGECGPHAYWYYKDETLVIKGTGKITKKDYCDEETAKNAVRLIIGDGITNVYKFQRLKSLAEVFIPSSVTSIGADAFLACTSLASVMIPDSVTSIGLYAFHNTAYYNNGANWENDVLYIGKYLINAKQTISGAYAIKKGTTCIASDAFYCCANLTSVTIPDSVTSLGEGAFDWCNSLTSVTIPDSVTSIENDTFRVCTKLESVTIGNGVTSIGEEAFFECKGLTSVTIPDSVTSIGKWAFSYCSSLTSVTIPDSVTSIGEYAFSFCDRLTSITYKGEAYGSWDDFRTANRSIIQ